MKALITVNNVNMMQQHAPVFTSADGLHWNLMPGAAWAGPSYYIPEPPNFAFWNPISNKYGFLVRPMWGDRRVSCCLRGATRF